MIGCHDCQFILVVTEESFYSAVAVIKSFQITGDKFAGAVFTHVQIMKQQSCLHSGFSDPERQIRYIFTYRWKLAVKSLISSL